MRARPISVRVGLISTTLLSGARGDGPDGPAVGRVVLRDHPGRVEPVGRGLHSFTSQLNLSAFRWRGGAFRGYLEGD